jgi:tetratricopeptide (TPR) repeat protein
MRAVALSLIVALLAGLPVSAQLRRPPDRLRHIESPAAPAYREGMKLLADEHWAEAADLFERAIDLDQQYALAFYGLGRARMGQKQFVAAVSALERCASLYLNQAAASTAQRMNISQIRRDQIFELRDQLRNIQSGPQTVSRQAAAERIMDMIRDLERDVNEGMDGLTVRVPAFVSLSLGSAHFRRGSMGDAEREYRNALKANPRMGEAHNNLAVVLLLTGRPTEAERSVKEAEKNGFRVPAAVKDDIRKAKAAAQS